MGVSFAGGRIARHGPPVWALARREAGGHHAAAEDPVQEVFVALWAHAARFDPSVASETTFVAMIARRRLIDRRRRLGRGPEGGPLVAIDQVAATGLGAEQVAPPDPFRSGRSAPLVASAYPLASGAGGILAWDQGRQEGALRVEGLAPVDPATGCYQLWIFDADRDARHPVDGGTFTVPRGATGRAVAVRPRVAVRRPTPFAVTLEPPGGVAVSDRARVLLTAAWTP